MRLFVRAAFLVFSFQGVIACAAEQPPSAEEIFLEEVTRLQANPLYQAVSGALYLDGERFTFHAGLLPEGGEPNDETLYEIGSLTKTYTGLMLAQAVEDGKIAIDDPVAAYLPPAYADNFERGGRAATIRDLAAHTSGLPINLDCGEPELETAARLQCYKELTRARFFSLLADAHILDEPGSQYRYSNPGIRLLAYILEDVYGQSYPELLEEVVFKKSHEQDTLFRLGPGDEARFATGRNQDGELMPRASQYYFGDGALKATARSFLDYMALYLESQDPVVKRALTVIAGETDGLGRAYVWNTFRYDSEGMLYHAGGTLGASSWTALYPREKLGVFLVTPIASPDAQSDLNAVSNRIVDRLRRELK